MSSISSGGGSYSGSYSSTPSYTYEKISFVEAISKAISGSMTPGEVFLQFPADLMKEVDKLSNSSFGDNFLSLSLSSQKEIFENLLNPPEPKKLTMAEAAQNVVDGKMKPMDLFGQLPPELKGNINRQCKVIDGVKFPNLPIEKQRAVFAEILSPQEPPKDISLKAVIKSAANGDVVPGNLYGKMPEAVRKILDLACQQVNGSKFMDATLEQQQMAIKTLLSMLAQQENAGNSVTSPAPSVPQPVTPPPVKNSRPVPPSETWDKEPQVAHKSGSFLSKITRLWRKS